MSLILEALKKSEQQRKLGEAPTLGSPTIAMRRRRNVLPVLVALIVIAGAAGWWLLREPTPTPTAPAVSQAGPTPIRPAATVMPVERAGDSSAAKGAGRSANSNPNISVAQRRQLAQQMADAKNRGATPPPVRTAPAPTAAAPKAILIPDHAAAKNATATPRKGVNEDRPVTPTPLPVKPVAPPVPVAAAPAATAPVARSKPNQPAVPSLFELPYAKRKDIPSIELTMHVYSADPSSRFVVIKGERHVEGDDLGDGLVLKQIRADGVVLDYKGTEFAFPRDGGH